MKTIVISAYGDMKNIRHAMHRGAFDFVAKPVDFEDVAFTIAKGVHEIQMQKEAEKTRKELSAVQCELDLAARIQRALLPRMEDALSSSSPVQAHAEMISARMVGGDFYDVFQAGPGKVAFLIGDVSGKGVPASLLMATTRTLMRAIASQTLSPSHCLLRANEFLCRENLPAMFVTMFYGILDTNSGEMEFSVAGHNMPYLLSAGDTEMMSADGGPVLGVLEDAQFPPCRITLNPGEAVLLYTDGATEAMNAEGDEFSGERVQEILTGLKDQPVAEIVPALLKTIQQYAAGVPQSDDITFLAIRYMGLAAQAGTAKLVMSQLGALRE
jgi:sigma-B regulation protein RsbU (phosphoserine phosphatase)